MIHPTTTGWQCALIQWEVIKSLVVGEMQLKRDIYVTVDYKHDNRIITHYFYSVLQSV